MKRDIASLLLRVPAQGSHVPAQRFLTSDTHQNHLFKNTHACGSTSQNFESVSLGEGPEYVDISAGIISCTTSSELRVWSKPLISFRFLGPFS